MAKIKTKGFKGKGHEIVLVGFEEIGPMGFAHDKYVFRASGKPAHLSLALKMGILEYRQKGGQAHLFEIKEAPHENAPSLQLAPLTPDKEIPLDLNHSPSVHDFLGRWARYIEENTGIRQLTQSNCGFDPHAWMTQVPCSKTLDGVQKKDLEFLQTLGLNVSDIEPVAGGFRAKLHHFKTRPFPFSVDFGGALPTGWRFDNLGLPAKEMKKMNEALWLTFETSYRTLLNATLHPAQGALTEIFSPERIGLYGPTGMGPMIEIERLAAASFAGESARPKQLSHCLANTVLGYLAPALGIKGKIATHVGACESVMGGFADAVRDLQRGALDAALVVGYDWSMAATAYNGFIANGAMITNEDVVKGFLKMIDVGAIDDSALAQDARDRVARSLAIEKEMQALQEKIRKGVVSKETGAELKFQLQINRLNAFRALPKKMVRWASMPFSKFRNGFVMSVGSGGGFLTTLEFAIQNHLPIRALVAGMGEKVPDGPGDGMGSIAVLGDGVGDAFERSFLEAQKNYAVFDKAKKKLRSLTINDVGAWWAHGTSTPTNGFGERREMQRILEKYKRKKPLPITGDKEIGHRLGGNFPSEAVLMLETELILPYHNYVVADETCETQFPLTKVVGKAGLGEGNPLTLQGDFVAINGAGFGKINSNIMLKKFNPQDLSLSPKAIKKYQKACTQRLDHMLQVKEDIETGKTPLIISKKD